MNRVFLSIGSNINKERNLPRAAQLLRRVSSVAAASAVYETVPVGTEDQPSFFNAAVLIETELMPEAIKEQIIGSVEQALERKREADINAARTIDVDIALFNDAILDYVPVDGRARHIPDPDLLRALHVIVPIAELAPDQRHPETGERFGSIAARLLEEAGEEPVIWLRDDIKLGD